MSIIKWIAALVAPKPKRPEPIKPEVYEIKLNSGRVIRFGASDDDAA